ncbi:MAG: proton-conducting transporter transmembrane domain-containing protein [Ignavibacteriaceae bacterium]
MNYLYIALGFFVLGFILTFSRRLSYLAAFIGSVYVFIAGVTSLNSPQVSAVYYLLPRISIGLNIDRTTSLFFIVSSISFAALSFYSIDFGRLFSKKMGAFFNLALFGMVLVMSAADSILFLIGWEIMTIALAFQILERRDSMNNAFQFLAFGEASTMFLLLGFAALYLTNNSFSLINGIHASALFLVLTTLGFIIKMDIFPFHTWIIGAYSKAPSHTAALLSAPLTLMGVYGLVRILSISNYTKWWGIMVLVLGAVSAFWGAMFSSAERSVKKLPAYSTVENNGMILTALGLSAIAAFYSTNKGVETLADFAFLAALFIAFSHTIAKTLLFISVGHAKEALQKEDIDLVRGIWRNVGKLPALGILTSGLSFSAFPPTIGFVGEWMILEALFQSYKFLNNVDRIIAAFAGIMVALAIGLATFAMIKLIGYTALGPDHGEKAHKFPSSAMKLSEIFLILLLFLGGIFSPYLIQLLGYGQFLSGLLSVPDPLLIVSAQPIFGVISPTILTLVVLVLLIIPVLFYIFGKKKIRTVDAWNGALPLSEDEYYTVPAYSFTLEYILRSVFLMKEKKEGYIAEVQNKDVAEYLYEFIGNTVDKISGMVGRIIMNGRISLYILYIFIIFILVFFFI